MSNVNNYNPTTANVSTSGFDRQIRDKFKLDRYLGDPLILPYTFEEIKIKANELVTADNFNACLLKLHHNFLYLNAQANIATNNFPALYKGFIASSKATGLSGLDFHSGTNVIKVSNGTRDAEDFLSTQLSAYGSGYTSGRTVLSGLVDGAFTQGLGSRQNHVGFVANSASLIGFHTSELNDATLKSNDRVIESSTDLSFTQIKSLTFNTEKNLFVLDDSFIHKFDVTSVLTDNVATQNIGKLLIKTIGGKGTSIFDKDKFGNPIAIETGKDDKIYVLDLDHSGVKIFDKDLNWKSTLSIRSDFNNELSGSPVVDLSVDKKTEDIYVLSEAGIILKYDKDGFLVDVIRSNDGVKDDEQYRKITQSQKNDNVMYVLSDFNLFKKFKSKPEKIIGAFRFIENKIEPQNFNFVSVLETDDLTYDFVFVGSDLNYDNLTSDSSAIFKFNEEVTYKSISRDTFKTNLFDLSAIKVTNEEYVTSWVINKSLHKFIYNHLLFKDSIFGKFEAKYDVLGRSQYQDTVYFTEKDNHLVDFKLSDDMFVGLNEVVLAETINRPLKQLYDLQNSLLLMCQEKYLNVYPLSNIVVGI